MYIGTNTSSNYAQASLASANNSLSKIMARLSSGNRINGAADDAAGLAISEKMTSQIRGMSSAIRNANDGISMLNTAESAMGSVSDIMQRMRELSIQADNDTYQTSDIASIQAEFDQLLAEIDHISDTTKFNGKELLSGGVASVDFHVSNEFDDVLTVNLATINSTSLTLTGLDLATDAQAAISALDSAIDTVSSERANLGASVNRLDFIVNNLESTKNNTSASRMRISDANMAHEMSELTKQRILAQTSMSMLQQSNSQSSMVLGLLQG